MTIKLGKNHLIDFYRVKPEYGLWCILPSIEYKHDKWYSWKVYVSWLRLSLLIDFCKWDNTYDSDDSEVLEENS